MLSGEDMRYEFSLSNEAPYRGEATLLEVNLTQLDHSKVMMFKFNLKQSDAYLFHQVSFKEYEQYHSLHHIYRYLIYPKKSGVVSVKFALIKSITDDDKVAYAISGDRDNVKGLVKEDVAIEVKPLLLKVKSVPKDVDLVGVFTLTHRLEKRETDAFEPVNVNIQLKGEGRLSSFEILKKSRDFTLFMQTPKLKISYSREGTLSSLEWDYALSAKKSFVLPEVVLKAFNPKTEKIYTLSVPKYEISVNGVDASTLLDRVDSPLPSKGVDWDFWRWIFSYLFVFLAGFLMPRDLFKLKRVVESGEEDILAMKIESAETHKALLQILLLENDVKFSEAILLLESTVYHSKNLSLAKIKSMVLN